MSLILPPYLSVKHIALSGWWLYSVTVIQNIELFIREIILNICLIHVQWGTLEQRGSMYDTSMVVALTKTLEARPGKRQKGTFLVFHRAASKCLDLSTLTLREKVVKAVRNNNLALQLGPWHFSADFMRSCVVVINISLCQILLHK